MPALIDFGSSQIISAVGHSYNNPLIEVGLVATGSIAGLQAVGRMALSGMAWLEQQGLVEAAQPDDFQSEV